MKGLKLTNINQSRQVAAVLHPFDKPGGTQYLFIRGRSFYNILRMYILNGALDFIFRELQVTMVDMLYWNDTMIYDYQWHIFMGNPE